MLKKLLRNFDGSISSTSLDLAVAFKVKKLLGEKSVVWRMVLLTQALPGLYEDPGGRTVRLDGCRHDDDGACRCRFEAEGGSSRKRYLKRSPKKTGKSARHL